MAALKKESKRGRGRPAVRSDEDTKSVIITAANSHFQEFGFAAANVNVIAKAAGVSTKTLYRLFPKKADVLASVVKDRVQRFFFSLEEEALQARGMREGLTDLLVSYGTLVLAAETIGIHRLVIAEAERFPDIAQTFYDEAITKTNGVFERWIAFHIEHGRVKSVDVSASAGMLRGMMVLEPQRAVFMRQSTPPSETEIRRRALACADLFLEGCRK